jgi:cell division transport system permease protein
VGATDTFVKWPFIIEGIMIGLIGGLASFLILKFAYGSVAYKISQALPFLPIFTDQFILTVIYTAVLLGGMALGLLGGYISVSRALKNEV